MVHWMRRPPFPLQMGVLAVAFGTFVNPCADYKKVDVFVARRNLSLGERLGRFRAQNVLSNRRARRHDHIS